tara:strand:+ start:215 stop:469 length:255 start_codon:yes stop_codon:yes gene_type:complete
LIFIFLEYNLIFTNLIKFLFKIYYLKKLFIVTIILLVKNTKMSIYQAFRRLNSPLLTTDLAVLETTIRATSRALQYWNIAFKSP